MKKNTEVKLFRKKSIIRFEGKNFQGEVGIDGRIFKALTYARISVGVISQQAIETGISVLVNDQDAERAVNCLIEEFAAERKSGKVTLIYSINNVSVLGFVTEDYNKIAQELARNNIFPLILNQVLAEKRVNIVVAASQDEKTRNIIETEIFAKPKTVHLAIFGTGNVGKTLISQILARSEEIIRRKKIDLKIVAIGNSTKLILSKNGFEETWEEDLAKSSGGAVEEAIKFAREQQLENLIAVDVTTSKDLVEHYPALAENGFDIVASNLFFNTLPISTYRNFRILLKKINKKFLYETNVGAGLPLIDTIKLLHLSGENITKIRGVFSGSMSYIFNQFSVRDEAFSTIVNEASKLGVISSSVLNDLSGRDVAQKLLILARELDLANELKDIAVEELLPKQLQKIENHEILKELKDYDAHFQQIKAKQLPGHVLRYIGELSGDLQQEKGKMTVKTESVPQESVWGQLRGSDSIFEIYTESYGENPIVIMGAGAGATVTARGVFGDILRISENK